MNLPDKRVIESIIKSMAIKARQSHDLDYHYEKEIQSLQSCLDLITRIQESKGIISEEEIKNFIDEDWIMTSQDDCDCYVDRKKIAQAIHNQVALNLEGFKEKLPEIISKVMPNKTLIKTTPEYINELIERISQAIIRELK